MENVIAFTGGGGSATNTGRMFIALKPLDERGRHAPTRSSRGCAASWPRSRARTLFLQAVQDIRVGGRASNAQYQYTLQGDNLDELNAWAPQHAAAACASCPSCATSTPTSRTAGCRPSLVIDRDTAARLGIPPQAIDDTLYDAFGQRQVSTMYTPLQPVPRRMEVDPRLPAEPGRAHATSTSARSTGAQVPLSAFTRFDVRARRRCR